MKNSLTRKNAHPLNFPFPTRHLRFLLGSYQTPFLLAGVPPLVGALAMFLVYRVSDQPVARPDGELGGAEDSLTDPKRQNG